MNLLHFKSGTPASWRHQKGTFTYIGTNEVTGTIITQNTISLAYDYVTESKLMKQAYLVYKHQHLMDTHTTGDKYEFWSDGVWKKSYCNNPIQFTDSLEYRRVTKDSVVCYDPNSTDDLKPVFVTSADTASKHGYNVINYWRA